MREIRFCFCHKGFDSSSLPSTSFSYKFYCHPMRGPRYLLIASWDRQEGMCTWKIYSGVSPLYSTTLSYSDL